MKLIEHIVGKNTADAMNQMLEQVKLLMNVLNYHLRYLM